MGKIFSIINKFYGIEGCRCECDDVVGDEDNCCEYGMKYPDKQTLSIFDLI